MDPIASPGSADESYVDSTSNTSGNKRVTGIRVTLWKRLRSREARKYWRSTGPPKRNVMPLRMLTRPPRILTRIYSRRGKGTAVR